jgi:hypothetical protein
MSLNPLMFDSQEAFEQALLEEGLKRGWTPLDGDKMISVEKPGSPSEVLAHYGRKGMKWGVRQRSQAAGAKAGKSAAREVRKSGGGRVEQRTAARKAGGAVAKQRSADLRGTQANLAAKRAFNQNFPTGKTRANEIIRARNAQVLRAAQYHAAPKGSPKREAARKAWMNSPDRPIAMRMTRGEKVVFSLLAAGAVASGPATGTPVGPAFAVGLGLGSAARVGARRNIERKQARGAYK